LKFKLKNNLIFLKARGATFTYDAKRKLISILSSESKHLKKNHPTHIG